MGLDFIKLNETTDPSTLLKMLKAWDDEETERYRPLHQEWEKNVLFFLGKQWLEIKRGLDGFMILDEDDEHYRPVSNHVKRLCNLKRSQVVGKNVRPIVRPNSDQKDDIDSARLGNLVLRAKHALDHEDQLNNLAFLHAEIFGIGWKSICKQPVAHDYMEFPVMENITTDFNQCKCGNISSEMDVCDQCGSKMEPTSETKEQYKINPMTGIPMVTKIPQYRVVVSIIDPFRMKVSPAALESDLRWITDSSLQPVSWLKDAFDVEGEGYLPDQVKKIKKSNALPRGLEVSQQFRTAVTRAHSSISKEIKMNDKDLLENQEESTILNKSYFPPTSTRKFGRLIVWTEHAILYDGKPDIPNNKKLRLWHPYKPFIYDLHPLRLEGIPYIEDLIPINKKYNSCEAIILEHLDLTAQPERYEFTNVSKNNPENGDGILRIDPVPNLPNGGIPGYLTHPQMASEVYNLSDKYVSQMEKVGNVTEVVQGLRPAGVDTYRGLQLLRDAADSSEAEMYNRYYEFVRAGAQLKLAIIQECLLHKDEELVEMMETIRSNENFGEQEVADFLGQDLRDNMNVVMEEADYLSQTKGAEGDKVHGLLENQILTSEDISDPYVKLQLLRKLGMGNMPMADKVDIEKAERLIKMVEAGEFVKIPPILRYFDNKGLQLRVISEWAKTSRFDSLKPQIQNAGMMLMKKLETDLLQTQTQNTQPPTPGAGAAPMGAPSPSPAGATIQ